MNLAKMILTLMLAGFLVLPSFAAEEKAAPNKEPAKKEAVQKKYVGDKKKPAVKKTAGKKKSASSKKAKGTKKAKAGTSGPIVLGKKIKVGMSLEQAIAELGIPKKITLTRGTEPLADSFLIEYPKHGLVIYAMNKKDKVEGIEVLPNFKGRFANGIRLKSKLVQLIGKYGKPSSITDTLISYPKNGLFFSLKNDEVNSAKWFAKNTKLLEYQLLSN